MTPAGPQDAERALAKAKAAFEASFAGDKAYLEHLVRTSDVGRARAKEFLEETLRRLEAKTDEEIAAEAVRLGAATEEEAAAILGNGKAATLKAAMAKTYRDFMAVAGSTDAGWSKEVLARIKARMDAERERHIGRLAAQLEAGGSGAEGDYVMKLGELKRMSIDELQEVADEAIDLTDAEREALSAEDVQAVRNLMVDAAVSILTEAKERLAKKRAG